MSNKRQLTIAPRLHTEEEILVRTFAVRHLRSHLIGFFGATPARYFD
jgi:hypothetical protein